MYNRDYWENKSRWPIDFDDKIFLFKALNRIGAAMHGDILWKGTETLPDLKPELPPFMPTQYEGRWRQAYFDLKMAHPELFTAEERKPEIVRANHFPRDNWTPERWTAARKMYSEINASHSVARMRFYHAKMTVVLALRKGQLQMFTRPVTGGAFSGPHPRELWNTEQWNQRFTAGRINPADPYSAAFAGDRYQYIFVDQVGLEKLEASFRIDGPKSEATGEPAGHQATKTLTTLKAENGAIKPTIDEDTAIRWAREHIDSSSANGTKTSEKVELALIKKTYPHLTISRTIYRKARHKAIEQTQRKSWLNPGPKVTSRNATKVPRNRG